MSDGPATLDNGEDNDGEITSTIVPNPFSSRIRIAAGVGGIALTVAGCIATFHTNNQAGTVAILALGAILLVVAMLGQQITRFRAGSYEIVFALLAQAGKERASGDEERAEALVDTAIDQVAAQQPGTTISSKAAGVAAEREILNALAGLPDYQLRMEWRAGKVRFDGLLEHAGLRIAVEVKTSRTGNIDHIIGSLVSMITRAEPPPNGVLLVIRGFVSPTKIRRLQDVASKALPIPVEVVEWHEDEGSERVQEGLAALLEQLRDTS